jgi:membrane-associated phospholipid phosphatase
MPDAERSVLRTACLLALVWLTVAGAVLALGWLVTNPLEPSVDPWDDGVVRWFASERTRDLDRVADAGTLLGDTPVGMGVAAVAALALSLWRRSVLPAVFLALLVAGIGGFYWVVTTLITRDRPPVRILDPGLVPDDSYPSGHVATALAVYGGIAVLLWVLTPRVRSWLWLLLLLPALVALARLYQGAHHPTDELASVLYTTAWMAVLVGLLLRGRAPDQ